MSAGWTGAPPDRDSDHQTLDITYTAYSTKIMLCATYLLAAWACACSACVSGLELLYTRGPGIASSEEHPLTHPVKNNGVSTIFFVKFVQKKTEACELQLVPLVKLSAASVAAAQLEA